MSEATDLQRLIENLSFASDEDLIRIINVDYGAYRDEALAVARAEMRRRGYQVNRAGWVKLSRNQQKQLKSGARHQQMATAAAQADAKEVEKLAQKPTTLKCSRCGCPLTYSGTRRLHVQTDLSVLGELGEMYKSGANQFLDAYTCNSCGHVELFADGVGEEHRPQ
jgi:hypothetical protein